MSGFDRVNGHSALFNMRMSLTDTIAAIATPYGSGAIGVIRVSGPATFKAVKKIFIPEEGVSWEKIKSYRLYRGWVRDRGRYIDEVMVVRMIKPKSYTGEDMVEVQAHGGRQVLFSILGAIFNLGVRPAEAGEFTKRAFLNGKIDLTQAESIAWLIDSKSEVEARHAALQLRGGLKQCLLSIKSDLVNLLSHVELNLDFEEIERENLADKDLCNKIKKIYLCLTKILKEAESGEMFRDGLRVVIVGKPNVGKSSLLNKFLKQKRAIVSSEPGTTRDTVEEMINIDGIPLRIIDTAGIRRPRNKIEEEGVARAKKKIREADLVLLVLDSGTRISGQDLQIIKLLRDKKALIVVNKADLPPRINIDTVSEELQRRKLVRISAKKNWGLPRLRKEIINEINVEFGAKESPGVYLSSKRRVSLEKAEKSVERSLSSAKKKLSAEFIALDLKEALISIKEILGEEYRDDVLKEIFSRFCVGK